MRRHLTLLIVLAAAACNGDNAKDGPGTTDTSVPQPKPSFQYQANAPARSYVASLTEDSIAAHQMSNLFLAATAVVSSDEKTRDQLITDGNGLSSGGGTGFECWSRPEFPMWTFDLNFEPCADQGFDMGGGVSIEDHASGPLLYSFNTFRIEDRSMGGTLALDTRGAVDAPLFWTSYNTDSNSPGLDNPVQLGISAGDYTSGASWTGGTSVNFLTSTWSMWGVLTLRPADRDFVIVHGGNVATDVPPDEAPGADAVAMSLDWQSCRCPSAGKSTYELDLQFDEIKVDVDDLEINDDGVDDPEITLVIEHTVSGTATVNYKSECGTFDVDYDVSDTVITVPNTTMVAAVSFLCDIRAIEDTARCTSITAGLARVGDFLIDVPQADVLATAKATLEDSFDGAWCEPQ